MVSAEKSTLERKTNVIKEPLAVESVQQEDMYVYRYIHLFRPQL